MHIPNLSTTVSVLFRINGMTLRRKKHTPLPPFYRLLLHSLWLPIGKHETCADTSILQILGEDISRVLFNSRICIFKVVKKARKVRVAGLVVGENRRVI